MGHTNVTFHSIKMRRKVQFMTSFALYSLLLTDRDIQTVAMKNNPVNGKHLKTLWVLHGKGANATIWGSRAGYLVIDYVARRLNFTYQMLENVTATTVETPKEGGRGLADYLFDGSCDILVHEILYSPARYAIMDMTLPWSYTDVYFMIPVPDPSSVNAAAVTKPFQWPIWALLIVSMGAVIGSIALFSRYADKKPPSSIRHERAPSNHVRQNGIAPLYAFGVLLSQGGPCVWPALTVRLVAAAWCLATFVLVNSYASTLITYIISHETRPLIQSVYDLISDPSINVIVEKGKAFDVIWMNPSNNDPITTQLRKKLISYPASRCGTIDECLNRVKSGPRNVLAQAKVWLLDGIIKDFTDTGKCSLMLAKKPYGSLALGWALRKRHPYSQAISQALTETIDYGFYWQWTKMVRPISSAARGCVEKSGKQFGLKASAASAPVRLKLFDLTGAFVVLAVGFSAAFLAYLVELIFAQFAKRQVRL